ncbi:MAG: aspartate kinase, partial [Gammaproteobacteria bacterium]
MGLVIQKFGGTSVASAQHIRAAAAVVAAAQARGHKPVVVVSAMGAETDRLAGLAAQVAA